MNAQDRPALDTRLDDARAIAERDRGSLAKKTEAQGDE
jgi:hypothetical protein